MSIRDYFTLLEIRSLLLNIDSDIARDAINVINNRIKISNF